MDYNSKKFLRQLADTMYIALCIMAGLYVFVVFYTIFSCFI